MAYPRYKHNKYNNSNYYNDNNDDNYNTFFFLSEFSFANIHKS